MSPSESAPPNQQQKIPGSVDNDTAGLSKAAKRNMKRKEKRKQQQHQGLDGDADVESVCDAVESVSIQDGGESSEKVEVSVESPDDSSAAENAKKIKNLKKKLRQVEDLQQKVNSGEIKQPTKEQLDKLARMGALQQELQQLELDQ